MKYKNIQGLTTSIRAKLKGSGYKVASLNGDKRFAISVTYANDARFATKVKVYINEYDKRGMCVRKTNPELLKALESFSPKMESFAGRDYIVVMFDNCAGEVIR